MRSSTGVLGSGEMESPQINGCDGGTLRDLQRFKGFSITKYSENSVLVEIPYNRNGKKALSGTQRLEI